MKRASQSLGRLYLSSCYFSQAFEDRHFTEREISFETLNKLRRTWIVASGLEDSAKTPPGYDHIRIFAQAAQATDIEQAKLRHLRFVSFETKPVRRPRSKLKAGSPRSATGQTTRAGPLSNRALRVAWKAGHLRAAKVFRALC